MWAPVAIVGVATAAWLGLGGGYPNFDTAYAVVWGDELLGGGLPDYGAESAPTPHPLATAFGTLAAVLGGKAYDALAVVAFLSLGGLVWSVYALGRECFSWRVGLLGALLVATSFTILSRTAASYFDLMAVALIVFGGLLDAKGRRGFPVLAVLAIAGLQRPEAWLLAAGYWLYLAPKAGKRDRLWLAVPVAAAPVLWATSDLIVTGDPFYSFIGTRSTLQEVVAPGHGSESVVSVGTTSLRDILRLPVLLGGAVGIVLGFVFFRARSLVPLTLVAFGLVCFVGLGLAGLPLADRFLFLPAAGLAIFCGVATVGWMDHPELGASGTRARWVRLVWVGGSAVLMIGLVASVSPQIDRLRGLRDDVTLRVRAVDDLRALAHAPAGAPLRQCTRIYVPNEQLIPILSYALDRTPRDVVSSPPREPQRGVFLEPRPELWAANAFFLRSKAGPAAPASFDRVAVSRYWTVRARGCSPGRA